MKPSERIEDMKKASEERYKNFDPDTKHLATALNMIHTIGEILDEMERKIEKLIGPTPQK
jgi:hypothetical protein